MVYQSQTTFCRNFGVSRNGVSTLLDRNNDSLSHRPGQDHNLATMLSQDRYLRLLLKKDRSAPRKQLPRGLYNTTRTFISQITVAKRLNVGLMYARYPAICISLTVNRKKSCLAWCQE
ncbi:HTH_Tnp_Tc3_2 domain-containing protein [Trichonephila clavipes]|nr:HTH_Tnp_Tc3_2 domain-containing protein [Trichonephila clavipes]